MKYDVAIGTQHKTGTVWMHSVFAAIANDLSIQFVDCQRKVRPANATRAIYFDYHSAFNGYDDVLNSDTTRLLHIIRDPRDVVISGMHYHLKSSESWLHKRSDEFDGKTYAEVLNDMPDEIDRYLFEMDQSGRRTIERMVNWNRSLNTGFEVKYEDLIEDHSTKKFEEILRFLGFDDLECEAGLRRYWEHSLFGNRRAEDLTGHVRSSKKEQWRQVYTPHLAREFLRHFPDALVALGYEKDNAWVDALQAEACCG